MATNYVQTGSVLDYSNDTGADIASGDVVVMGSLVGVAITDIADGELGAVSVEGVWRLPKVTTEDIGAGDYLTFDVSAGGFIHGDTTPATGDLVGGCVAMAAAANGVSTVLAKLNVGASSIAA